MRTPRFYFTSESVSLTDATLTAPVWNRNRTLGAGYAVMNGRPESHSEGVYYLRFLRGGKQSGRRSARTRTLPSLNSGTKNSIFNRLHLGALLLALPPA